jgi:hypothetical protein
MKISLDTIFPLSSRCRRVSERRLRHQKRFALNRGPCYDRSNTMLPNPDHALTADQVHDLEEIVADAAAPDLMRSAARRVLADPAARCGPTPMTFAPR